MVGQRLDLLEVPLCSEVEVRLTLVVVRELLIADLPADRLFVLDRREGVAEARGIRPVAAEGADLLSSVGMMEAQAVPRRLCERAAGPSEIGSTSSISQKRPSSRSTSPGSIGSSEAYW